MKGGSCATKYLTASGSIVRGTDFPAEATQVYVHWAYVVSDGAVNPKVSIQYPTGTTLTLIGSWSPDGSMVILMDPSMRIPLTDAGGDTITIVITAAANFTIGYTWS